MLGRRGRVLKWTGLATSLAAVVVYVASGIAHVTWGWRPSDYRPRVYQGDPNGALGKSRILILESGCLYLYQGDAYDSQVRLRFGKSHNYPPNKWGGYDIDLWPVKGSTAVPLWIPLVVIAIPTAFLFWLDRRRIPSGYCKKCGYDLTGNVSGICPECGEKT